MIETIALFRRWFHFGMAALTLALMLVLMPAGVWAAPYAACVLDARTGEVLYEQNADARLHPASLTKMMTLYIAFQAVEHGEISLDSLVTVSKYAANQPPSRLGLRPGQQIALRYLIRAAAIKSANDAAAAIGEGIEGNMTNFAARMNRTAKALGMSRTTFRNANGLTAEGHLSTARDMATLGRRLFYDFPQYYSLFSRRSADAGMAQVASTNRRFLDSYEGADGIKTGYTAPAGFNLVASAQHGDVRIIGSIFGGTSPTWRNQRMAQLLDPGFQKAPARVAVQLPPPISYQATAGGRGSKVLLAKADTSGAGDLVADTGDDVAAQLAATIDLSQPLTDESMMEDGTAHAVASSVQTQAPPAAKTIRLDTAVASSVVPKLKADVQTAASDVAPDQPLDQAADPEADTQLADAEPADDPLASMSDQIAAAVSSAQTHIAAAPGAEPAQQADAVAPEIMPLPKPGDATELASADVLPAPDAAPPAGAQVAFADISSVTTLSGGLAPAGIDEQAPMAAPRPAAMTDVPPGTMTSDLALPEAASNPDAAPLAPPKPTIMLASAETTTAAPAPLEVVTRVSTSGGREWGITVGQYAGRASAEKKLLQTALIEMESLGDALRKVNPRKGGYGADFVGMTQASAEQACRRLKARGSDCTVIGPTAGG